MNPPRAWLGASDSGPYLLFECPGCRRPHGIPTAGPRAWAWNGSLEAPTVSPSILVRSATDDGVDTRCHSFVRDGRIEFLGDCTHELAGRTVDLAPVD